VPWPPRFPSESSRVLCGGPPRKSIGANEPIAAQCGVESSDLTRVDEVLRRVHMSSHNKWSTIKHKKGKADAKRGKLFTKIIRELTTAAREGGGDANGNPRLRTAVLPPKRNTANDTMTKAIQRGTGELPGVRTTRSLRGVTGRRCRVMLQVLTDNRNRTTAEIRHLFAKARRQPRESVRRVLFKKQGYLIIPKSAGVRGEGDGGGDSMAAPRLLADDPSCTRSTLLRRI